ncbi:hypothetical protein QYE76_008322 [Lolium multiflorum]|uniref:Uncharacterized protein n=1 Tax=Lolium multiflorum TaxID=4521 RepID=A0AAD8QGZ2_LOLMU|nr:hypothetical protein QYE76_008322 [Lolium multiflorum]
MPHGKGLSARQRASAHGKDRFARQWPLPHGKVILARQRRVDKIERPARPPSSFPAAASSYLPRCHHRAPPSSSAAAAAATSHAHAAATTHTAAAPLSPGPRRLAASPAPPGSPLPSLPRPCLLRPCLASRAVPSSRCCPASGAPAQRRCFEVDTGCGVAGVFDGASRIFFGDSLTRLGIWTYHGEKAKKRARKEVRQIQPRGEYDTGFDRCLENLANGNVPESPHVEVETPQDAETSEDPEENTKEYYEALFASQKPLHENTEVTQLDAIARLMALKCHRNLCRDGFDELLVIVGSLLPKGHLLPQNFYYSTKLLSDLKMSSQQIHACPKGCMLFREEHADTNYCIKCNSSRYFEVDRNGDGQKRQTTVAKNILRYLPVPRIQRLFMTEDTAQQMRWAVEGNRYTDKMIHPSDGTAWKNFVKKFPLKAGDPRSVAVAISTDGFNPYVQQAVTFFWLNKGGKYSCFDEARQFLERRHAYRSDVKSFKKGRVVRGPKPIPKTGTEIKAELDALKPSPDGNGFLGYGETHQWTHKPCLWKLPYFEFLELPHNIDVMHTEKNISEAIWSTIVDTEKTKDNIKARIDQEMWCDRPELNMQPPHGAKNLD